jgi:uncharacterized protein (TIGR03382 family)
MRATRLLAPATLLLLALPAQASQVISGSAVRIGYNSYGTWNNSSTSQGFQAYLGGSWVDFTYPGTPYHRVSVEFDDGGTATTGYSISSGSTSFSVSGEADVSRGTTVGSSYSWTAGNLGIRKVETWDTSGSLVRVVLQLTNNGASDITNLRVFYGTDPDQDYAGYGNYSTLNDTLDTDGDGTADWVQSVGPSSGYTLGFTGCETGALELGHYSGWGSDTDADTALTDNAAASGDIGMGVRWSGVDTLAPGDTTLAVFLVSVGSDATTALATVTGGRDTACEEVCDSDGDGVASDTCGGDDCDDSDASVYTGAPDAWYDGVDSDCAGNDDYDADGDGDRTPEGFGTDCDDADAAIYGGAPDAWYDGIDGDCAGNDDYDADADGYRNGGFGGDDCADDDASIYPGAEETYYDGVDSNCDLDDEYDADGDGYDSAGFGGTDCDESDAAVNPDAEETHYDGEDSNCDPDDEYDADGDGHATADGGGMDCDDTDGNVSPDATESPYDGVDQDCDGLSDDDDLDGDGATGANDCDDADPSVQTDCGGNTDDTGDANDTGTDANDDPNGEGNADDESGGTKASGCNTTGSTAPATGASVALLAGALLLGRRRR